MTFIGCHNWKIDMVMVTEQKNETEANTAEENKGLPKNSYQTVMWQYNTSVSLWGVLCNLG